MELDHIVHFVGENPKEAAAQWRKKGFHAAVGGQHLKWGTHNALFYLKDSYIEWLSVENEKIASQAEHPLTRLLLHDQIGFGTICLRTENIRKTNEDLEGRGIKTTGVLNAERRTEAGQLIKWKMLFIEEEVSAQLPFPFFIEWEETGEQRYKQLRANGAIQALNETLSIDSCVFGVWDVEEAADKWRKLLGGSLDLSNCRIVFRKTNQQQERLEEVNFTGGETEVEFEQGLYRLPLL
ncbi:VOC family protein [Planococcus sp. CPCC 101016]|uniref:VOC family protein n=1 Tax=Planococcus sp. CPCC 101016 TaxID=2599617 RepID=UPI0011B7E740|nr:VOC family protein [Planococcus sp. CPCC 101016]TWT04208.1 VOC family protein [Planococcus sp. CPCC 101016]